MIPTATRQSAHRWCYIPSSKLPLLLPSLWLPKAKQSKRSFWRRHRP